MSVGLALIAKDEERSLPRLLASVEGAFDRVVVVDTGSRDRTVEVFREWARGEQRAGRLGSWVCANFEWRDDFAAARTFADSFLSGMDWFCWADCDDEIRGAEKLREVASGAEPGVAAFVAEYEYDHDAAGRCVLRLLRERLVRNGRGRWQGRHHDTQEIDGQIALIPANVVKWVHHQDESKGEERKATRIRILRAELRENPGKARVLRYLGEEEAGRGRYRMAAYYFRRFLAEQPPAGPLDPVPHEERSRAFRWYAHALLATGRPGEAMEVAYEALGAAPPWPVGCRTLACLTLAELHLEAGQCREAAAFAEEVLRRGAPPLAVVSSPQDYDERPRAILAACRASGGG